MSCPETVVVEDVESAPVNGIAKNAKKRPFWQWICGCNCCCCCCIVVLAVVAAFVARALILDRFTKDSIAGFLTLQEDKVNEFCSAGLTMANITHNIWWPGCESGKIAQSCTEPCYNASILESMDAFNKANPGRRVSYPSRTGKGEGGKDIQVIQLTGWWLPAPEHFGNSTPRIVLQHGFTANSNKDTVQLVAFMLRSLGFSVLVNNFRDHCYSGKSTAHISEWGHAYPYDLLGAWDYAKNDPDDLLGGNLSASMVGLHGYSKGAFIASTAFGMEGAVPGVWVNAPPFTPKVVWEHGGRLKLTSMNVPKFLADMFVDPTWNNMLDWGLEQGVDFNEHLPEDTLPTGPDTGRMLYWVGNKDDATVPIAEGEKLVALLEKYPAKYSVETFRTEGSCHGNAHHFEMYRNHEDYKQRLCGFWTRVFNLGVEYCNL